ncbi:ATPase domain-containing protein [Vulcanisaeta thermophila]|uniref:ATPase domain-containing protein n=1 Tax=Vulcanisaeta thermophila TaxID=867917 RepID=UPI0009FDC2C1|nr:ATPase domain-containing protein [Vulcanisaeta thermophila]
MNNGREFINRYSEDSDNYYNNYYNYNTTQSIDYYQNQYYTTQYYQYPYTTQTIPYPQDYSLYYYSEDKAPTGIYNLDQYLGGGFKRGEVYLIAGEAGTGKTIFSLTFLKTGADAGEVGMYVSVDEPSEDVKRGVRYALGWDLDSYEQEGKLIMADFRTYFRIYTKEEKLTVDPRDLAKMIIEQVRSKGVKRLVIDPIAPLIIMSHQDVIWIREYLRELVFQLKKLKDVTTVMTSEIPTGEENKLSRFGVEEYLASGVIMLSLRELNTQDGGSGCLARIMFIRKMRWMPIRPIKLIYDIKEPYGIIIHGPLNNNYVIQNYCSNATNQAMYWPYPQQQQYPPQYYPSY